MVVNILNVHAKIFAFGAKMDYFVGINIRSECCQSKKHFMHSLETHTGNMYADMLQNATESTFSIKSTQHNEFCATKHLGTLHQEITQNV
jgi:hypothetical protein